MKIVILSDHTQDKVQEAAGRRQAEYDDAMKVREDALRARQQRKDHYLAQLRMAWRARQWWAVVSGAMTVAFGALPHVPGRPVLRSAERDEIVYERGGEGEKRVRDHLARLLGDEWTLIMGYKNPKGEVDQILVGPSGVFALEIKFINGTVHCDGDRWWRDKYDRYGNLVETSVPIADKRGRGPSRQLNEAADSLQQFLSRRIGEGRVRRAVVLSHDASRIGTVLDVRVDLVTTLATWDVRSFVSAPTVLDDEGVSHIVDTIRQDHDFHEQRLRRQVQGPHASAA